MPSISELVQKNPLVGYALVAVPLLIGCYLIYARLMTDPYAGPSRAYFYNLSAQELVSMPNATLAPEDLGGGAVAVRALVYSCGDCSDETQRTIAYLEKYSDQAKALHEKYPKAGTVPTSEAGPLMRPDATLVATVEGALNGEWEPSRGSGLPSVLNSPCPPNELPTICVP